MKLFNGLMNRYFGKRSEAMQEKKAEQEQALELEEENEADEEELPELSLYAEPEKGTKFHRGFIMYSLIGVAIVFTAAFVYGVSTSGPAPANSKNVSTKEAVEGDHLQNVPKTYNDSKNKSFQESPPPRQEKAPQQPVTQPAQPAPRSYPSAPPPRYTPIPAQSQPTERQPQEPRLSAQEKIALQRAKEKLDANKSPIRFKIEKEEEKTP